MKRSSYKNGCECFIRSSKHRETNKSFYCFEVFGGPDETRSTSFRYETIGNYGVTCFRKRNDIEDITRWREDMNFIFEWQNNILRTSAASE